MNICIYDATESSAVGLSWKIGARLYKALGRFDAIHGATSWGDAFTWANDISIERNITSMQFWGHGSPGRAYIGGSILAHDGVLTHGYANTSANSTMQALQYGIPPTALIWFRTCSTAAGPSGHQFMASWAEFFGCKVAAHTHVIGLWHSGLQTLMPGETPTWSTDATHKVSSPTEPRTIPFWANSFPKEW